MKDEKFEKFMRGLECLFCGMQFNDKERKEMMYSVILPTFVVTGYDFTYKEGK